MMPSPSESNNNAEPFATFFRDWLTRQEHFLHELLQVQPSQHDEEGVDHESRELIGRVITHYKQYYEFKSRIVHQNVFLVLSPPWFSPYERTFLWISGFKPGLAFRIVNNSVSDLDAEQGRQMERLVEEIKAEERELAAELVAVQEALAAAPILALARREGRLENGRVREVDNAMERVRSSMEELVESADYLRTKTVVKVMEILNTGQSVRFLAAAAQLQLRIRSWGQQRDAARRNVH
ncbi:hypothetical protein RJ639_001806 [Escallonia herrerae]|uniref:DOG1 domain-containing protein n=1 Tax=Escallonia herrerae TaxID=1293975 RepID=A0AA89BFQ5_9ASTE|nr:hypothetical protein RJ639_001806 [Escallonia herrerae]